MDPFKVEYLITFKTPDTFCDSVKTYRSLLEADSRISIKGNKLNFHQKEFGLKVTSGKTTEQEQPFFQIETTCDDEKNLEDFRELLKVIRKLSGKADGEVNVLWDDLGIHYTKLAYPIISHLENILRKLITKFMLTTVGAEWAKIALPAEVKTAADMNKRSNSSLLHKVDFIHLADFLFKPYQTEPITELFRKISKAEKITDLELEDLMNFVPKSNWERYFKKVVDCEDDFLLKRWKQMYDLRCLIAHNNFLNKSQYDEIVRLSDELIKPLSVAIEKLEEVVVPEDEMEMLAENVIGNLNSLSAQYLETWRDVEKNIRKLYRSHYSGLHSVSIMLMVEQLVKDGVLEQPFMDEFLPVYSFRIQLIHGLGQNLDKATLEKMIEKLNHFYVVEILFEPKFS